MKKSIILLLIFIIGCKSSNNIYNFKNNLPSFNALEIPIIDDFCFISINPKNKEYNIFYKNTKTVLDSVFHDYHSVNNIRALLFIDKVEKMKTVFQLENELRIRDFSAVYYISKNNKSQTKKSLNGIGLLLPISNQSGTLIHYNGPPPPNLKQSILKYPYDIYRIEENGIRFYSTLSFFE